MKFISSNSGLCGIWFLGFVLMAGSASAHTSGESYVWLNVEKTRLSGRVELNLNDLRDKLDLPVPKAADARLAFLEKHREKVVSYINEHYWIKTNDELVPLDYHSVSILDLPADEGSYAQYHYLSPEGSVPKQVTIRNSLFVADSWIHRSLVCIKRNALSGQTFEGEFTAMVFGAHSPVQELDLTHIELLLRPRDFVWQGVLHIWIGLDHILFICALLLPAVLSFKRSSVEGSNEQGAPRGVAGNWEPVPNFKNALWNLLRIVTLFTLAHSITLSLASLGLVRLPSRLIESVIALSIVLVAWNTVTAKFQDKAWIVIFGFGLFHGMGFASVMSDLPFRMLHLYKILLGFNVGVELGQLAIVAVVFPVLFLLRRTSFYVPVILKGGSVMVGLIALYWFVERAFALGGG